MRKRFYLPYNKYQEPIITFDGTSELTIAVPMDYWVDTTDQMNVDFTDVEKRLKKGLKKRRKLLID